MVAAMRLSLPHKSRADLKMIGACGVRPEVHFPVTEMMMEASPAGAGAERTSNSAGSQRHYIA